MVKINAILWVDEEALKQSFEDIGSGDEYTIEGALETEIGWVSQSGITLGDYEIADI